MAKNKKKRPHDQVNGSQGAQQQRKKRKTRIHPSEAHHRIDELEELPNDSEDGFGVDAAALVASLGLSVSGQGRGTEVWFVGSGEKQTEKK